MEKERIKVGIQSPYPLVRNSPDGVKDNILATEKSLRVQGFDVTKIGPYIKDKRNNLADHTLGRAPIKFSINNTNWKGSISFNKKRAHELHLVTKADVIVFHEPFASNAAHTSISAMPIREDGKPFPAVIANFHARIEDMDWITRRINNLAEVRRPKFNKYGVFIGWTQGFKNTVFNSMDGRIAVSKATANFWNEISPADYEIIYNPIDTQRFTPEGPRIEKWDDGRKTILFTGRHDEKKGIDDLIVAFSLLVKAGRYDIKLKITGKGEKTKNLQRLAKDLGVKDLVEFVGNLPDDEFAKANRSADLLIVPSRGGEGFNRTIINAESSGTLVVATNIDGQNEAISEGLSSFMARPKDPRHLAEKIAQVLDLPEETKQRLRREAVKDVKNRFDANVIGKKTATYYKRILYYHGRTPKSEWPKRKKQRLFSSPNPFRMIPSMAKVFDARSKKTTS
ncbi:glycosyltransferase [Candidatus Roizmanbacteria bacterium]|nr:glycosyltransferase [Candidatus Roizmanbacteria bacterium]